MGVVYAAFDEELNRKVALKFFYRVSDREARKRARREAQALARLSHPNVVHVYDVGESDGRLYLAMELIDGVSLRKVMSEERPWRQIVSIMEQAARGLAAAHAAGLVHRDFKPENVLVDHEGRARVVDFGLACEGDDGGLLDSNPDQRKERARQDRLRSASDVLSEKITQAGEVMGTPAYMAPEQLLAGRVVGASADQFAFCVTLYEALYGARPFVGRKARARLEAIKRGPPRPDGRGPNRLLPVLTRGMSWSPEARWPSMHALAESLDRGRRPGSFQKLALAAMALFAVGLGYGLAQASHEVKSCALSDVARDAYSVGAAYSTHASRSPRTESDQQSGIRGWLQKLR
jgi:serine/threonine protein kinase